MSTRRATAAEGRLLRHDGFPAGWYPDPDDPAHLRYWDGGVWTDHRAALSTPANNPAVCGCGVVATGSCRACARPFCRAHISDHSRDDNAFLKRWEAWTCEGCIQETKRAMRSDQLQCCEDVAEMLSAIPKMRTIRKTRMTTGYRPQSVNLFERIQTSGDRPPRYARAYLVQYDGGSEDSTYEGLAISADGGTVFDVGVPAIGVRTARIGPKRRIRGYRIRREITLDGLREAAAGPTTATWFEFASRSFLRAAARVGLTPEARSPADPQP